MARKCSITGKRYLAGNEVSHSNRKTKKRSEPNLQWKRFWVASENRWVRLRVSAAAIRTIDQRGVEAVLREARARGMADA